MHFPNWSVLCYTSCNFLHILSPSLGSVEHFSPSPMWFSPCGHVFGHWDSPAPVWHSPVCFAQFLCKIIYYFPCSASTCFPRHKLHYSYTGYHVFIPFLNFLPHFLCCLSQFGLFWQCLVWISVFLAPFGCFDLFVLLCCVLFRVLVVDWSQFKPFFSWFVTIFSISNAFSRKFISHNENFCLGKYIISSYLVILYI